jgi:ABC-type branched-subunit amino acid transport system ATPase component
VDSEALRVLMAVGLKDPNALVGALSGGQRRRLALASALLGSPVRACLLACLAGWLACLLAWLAGLLACLAGWLACLLSWLACFAR